MSDRPRLVLGEEDFASPPPPPAAPARPNALPPVTRSGPTHVQAGAPGTATPKAQAQPAWLTDPRIAPLLAAAIGMAAAWGVTEILSLAESEATTKSELNRSSALWTGVIALVFVGVVVSFDRAVHGGLESAGRRFLMAAVPAFVTGYASGYIAQALYTAILENIYENATTIVSPSDTRLYLARMAGWAVFGLGTGVAVGLVERSSKRTINAAIGGVVGGAAGGLIFHAIGNESESGGLARLLGLLAIGLLVALAVRLVETVRREAWLSIVAGGMSGKEFIIYHPVTRIGASPDCEIFLLKDPAVGKLHAQIADHGTQRVLTAADGAATFVNQTPVSTHTLRHGDQIQVGSTVIAYSERAAAPAPAAAGQWR